MKLEQLLKVRKVVTHVNCADGMASAILIRDVMPDVEIVFLQYQTEGHKKLEATPGLLFADFSPHESRVEEFVQAGALVLDHHKTAKEVVERFGENGFFGDEVLNPGICGAVLTYEHVWKPLKQKAYDEAKARSGDGGRDAGYLYEGQFDMAEDFAKLAGIRDTWQNKDPRWEEASIQASMLRFYPAENWLAETDVFTYARKGFWRDRMVLGKILEDKHTKSVQKSIEKSFRTQTPKGTTIVILSGTNTTSDAADVLEKEADLILGFNFEVEAGKAKLYCSTRSRHKFDCGAFCKSLGGGGHTNAAGFNVPFDPSSTEPMLQPFALIPKLVHAWESQPPK